MNKATRSFLAIVIVAISLLVGGSEVRAGEVSDCTIGASLVQKSVSDYNGYPFSIRAQTYWGCPYTGQFGVTIEIRRDIPLSPDDSIVTKVWTAQAYSTAYYTMNGYVAKSGCDSGLGKYWSIVTLTDEVSGESQTVSTARTTLGIDCD